MLKTIENDLLKIVVDNQGAELRNLILKEDNKDYLWRGDPKYWGRKAPVLFPVVGRLKDDKYLYDDQEYQLSQHGFARDRKFKLFKAKEDSLSYFLEADSASLEIYPFKFRLEITYSLAKNILKINYKVINQDSKKIYYSIGAHPAFSWPFKAEEAKEDYYLEFEKEEQLFDYTITKAGLLNQQKELLAANQKKLNLYAEIFKNDALVFKDLNSNKITLKSQKSDRKIEVEFKDFPYLGIWSQSAEAPFICIEPWQGIADSLTSSGQIEEKEGIMSLEKGKSRSCEYQIKIS